MVTNRYQLMMINTYLDTVVNVGHSHLSALAGCCGTRSCVIAMSYRHMCILSAQNDNERTDKRVLSILAAFWPIRWYSERYVFNGFAPPVGELK